MFVGKPMVHMEKKSWTRRPLIVDFEERRSMAETYGFAGSQNRIFLEGQHFVPRSNSDTVFIFMHPTSTLQLLPMPAALADAGLHVICAGSRYAKNDAALIMEKVAIDLGAYTKYAREELGYSKVVLVGWSGGGSLSLFYQAQAENPTITQTPAGDPCDLIAAKLSRADGVIFIAAHLSRAETLTEWLDPSVKDELKPDIRDIEMDIYNDRCPNQPPYSEEFVRRFRDAQRFRNRKITAWVKEMLEVLRHRKTPELERAFITHRTMCDVRWLDATIDPNGRLPGWCYMGDPRSVNVGPVGLARFSTLRSWLSQWSFDDSNAKGSTNAPLIRETPVLQIAATVVFSACRTCRIGRDGCDGCNRCRAHSQQVSLLRICGS
jgi:pimeloyl-ACP methyl ester carboxylesterase